MPPSVVSLKVLVVAGCACLAALALPGGGGMPEAARAQPAAGFSLVFASDPQLTWWRARKGGVCVGLPDDEYEACVEREARSSNGDLIAAMNGVTSLGTWPATGLTKGAGAPVSDPTGAILNGDLTASWLPSEKELYEELYAGLRYPIYPGLGNHDVGTESDCGYQPIYFPDTTRCAKEAIWWMARKLGSLPSLVNHHGPGFVAVRNGGAYNVRFTVRSTVRIGGVPIPDVTSTVAFEAGKWMTMPLPPGSYDVSVAIEGLVFVATDDPPFFDIRWKTLRTQSLGSHAATCFATTGTALIDGQGTEVESCGGSAFPDGSSGSLSYSFDVGDYHFVQLQHWPGYTDDLPAVTTIEDVLTFGLRSSPGFRVTSSYGWLRDDLQRATAQGKHSVINMHDVATVLPGSGAQADVDAFAAAIRDQDVVGIFAGHTHQNAGRVATVDNGRRSNIPVFQSGSAECRTFLNVDFQKRHYNVAVVDATGAVPSYLAPGWTCDTFDPYDKNQGSGGTLLTYDLNRTPAIQDLDPATSPVVEGGQVFFFAELRDGDGDELRGTWDFGDGGTAEQHPLVPGRVSSPLHVYKDDGVYTVTLTVEDEFGGRATHSAQITVENAAPTLTVGGRIVDEDGVVTLEGTIADAGVLDAFTLRVEWGDGEEDTFSYPAGTTAYAESHRYLDDDPSGTPVDVALASLTLSDGDGGSASALAGVIVRNLDPVASIVAVADELGSVVGAEVPFVLAGQEVTLTASATDAGTRDTHTTEVDWGDGSPLGSAPLPDPVSHRFGAAGAYVLALTVVDDDTGRSGAVTATVEVVGVADAIVRAAQLVSALAGQASPPARHDLEDAVDHLIGNNGGKAANGALDGLLRGQPHKAVLKLGKAVASLESAGRTDPALELGPVLRIAGLTAKSIAADAVQRAGANASKPGDVRKVDEARALLAAGDAHLAAARFGEALAAYDDAVRRIQSLI